MVIDFYNRNGGGGGGTADYATLAGESNKSKLLEGASAPPQSANTGDVVAIAPNPTRGLRSARTLGIYQYDGTNWNEIGGETPDFTSLKPVSDLPASGETGEVVALATEGGTGYEYGITFEEMSYDEGSIMGGRFTFPTTGYSELDGESYSLGSVSVTFDGGQDGGTYDLTLSYNALSDELILSVGDTSDPDLTVYMGGENENVTEYVNWMVFQSTLSNENYIIDIYPYTENDGETVTFNDIPTSEGQIGLYQYDGTNWNKIEGGEGSSAYKIELTEVNPQNYTQQDIANLNAFCAAFTADTSIADSAYIYAVDGIYRCVRYVAIPNSPIFTFEGTFNNNIVDIWLNFSDGRFSYGSLQNAVPTPPTPEFTSIKPTTELPENPVDGEIVLLSEETLIDYRPEAPNGQTVYGGSLEEFMVAIKGTSNNELWVKTWDDAGHTERTDQGYFHLENDAIDYYDYQGDMDYLFNDLNEGEWADANTIYLLKEGNNLYFYVKQEAEGVFFPDTDATMVFDTVITDNTLNQYDGGDWNFYPQVLYNRTEFPKNAGFGDVVGLGKTEEREATSADVFTSATVTMVNGRATFKMYNPNYSGYCEDYTFGYDVNEGIIGGWGGENNVINGPWSNQGVEFTIDGDDITFTTQNPENTNEALQMWGFDPNCNDRIVVKELGIYQKDEEGWNRAVTSNSINSIVKLTQAEYDALVSGGTVDSNTFYVIISPNS